MKQQTWKCQKANHSYQQIEYICKYPLCQDERLLCSKCALEDTHLHDQLDNSHIELKCNYDQKQQQQIQNAKYEVHDIPNAYGQDINIAAVSNNLKFIVTSEQSNILNVWDYHTKKRIKAIKFYWSIDQLRFTEDSKLLYVACLDIIYQVQVNNQFKQISLNILHELSISNLHIISNKQLLTSSYDGTIIITDYLRKKQLFIIKAHRNQWKEILGLDFNKRSNIIASAQGDQSIKLWNLMDRTLIIQKQNTKLNHYQKMINAIYETSFRKMFNKRWSACIENLRDCNQYKGIEPLAKIYITKQKNKYTYPYFLRDSTRLAL